MSNTQWRRSGAWQNKEVLLMASDGSVTVTKTPTETLSGRVCRWEQRALCPIFRPLRWRGWAYIRERIILAFKSIVRYQFNNPLGWRRNFNFFLWAAYVAGLRWNDQHVIETAVRKRLIEVFSTVKTTRACWPPVSSTCPSFQRWHWFLLFHLNVANILSAWT